MTHNGFENPMAFDMALQEPVFAMMRRGILIDSGKREQFSEEYNERKDKLQSDLNRVVGHTLNTSSHPQMVNWLYEEMRLPKRTKKKKITADEDALRSLLALSANKMQKARTETDRVKYMRAYMGIMLALKLRTTRKNLESYIDGAKPKNKAERGMDKLVDKDGRMRTLLAVGGTETGRFSASKTLWNTGCNLQTIPHNLRIMYVADEGKELAEFDLNRGESWVYAHLSQDPELMRIHRSMGDFHSETAVAIGSAFGGKYRSVDEIKRDLKAERFIDGKPNPVYIKAYRIRYLGKKNNHANAYQMGPFRAAEVINEEADETGITVTVAESKQAQELWRHKYHVVPDWWDWIERKLGEDRVMTTPYGRTRQFFGYWNDQLLKEATAYVPQSTSVDYLNLGMLRVWRELVLPGAFGLELLHQNHDSILVQYDKERRDEVIPEVASRLLSKLVIRDIEFTIPVEASYGPNWEEIKEYDLPSLQPA